ncbi:aspartyl protease family protein [Hymenobacter persicinus]|uniref:PDZ domain-containing protein n=1 Tax=Hymenobacter persicinus TaxID=2025506 RepID=A0A4V1ZAC4_9BACT|nr:aspartyl protease family protein [Hymenobacter persicinus]RYU77173.1 PDZ domain-containing protein [Hymenobacter persicinus]
MLLPWFLNMFPLDRSWCSRSLLGLLLLGPLGWAQPMPFRLVSRSAHRVRSHFELQRNLIILSAKLNGTGPYNFLLDTGVGTSILTDPGLRETLNLRAGQRFRVLGAGNEAALEAFQTDSVRVELPGIVGAHVSFLVLSEDVLNLSGYVGTPIHGILGYDLFRSFVVSINPAELSIVFADPAHYRPPRGKRWANLPLDLEGNKAYITLPVSLRDSLTLPLKLILDTGAGHALSLETSSDPRLSIPPQRLRTQLGRGLSGFINGYLGRVAAVQLGRYRLKTLLTSFPDADNVALRAEVPRNGNIGFELLKRFDLVINYPHNYLLLRPNELFREPFEHDMCGFDLLATGPDYRRYVVLRVQPDSPAALAGLRPDDEIVYVNLLPISSLTLTQVSRIFHSANGRQILLVVRRASGDLYTTTVRLKRQI